MNQVITLQCTPAGVDLLLAALNQLPRGQVDALWHEIEGQYVKQLQALRAAALEKIKDEE